jgi:hypothetical protein
MQTRRGRPSLAPKSCSCIQPAGRSLIDEGFALAPGSDISRRPAWLAWRNLLGAELGVVVVFQSHRFQASEKQVGLEAESAPLILRLKCLLI